MKTYDRIFAAIFGIVGAVVLYGVLFKGATWHIPTVILCVVLVIVFLADTEAEDNENAGNETDEGYDKVNDHHPYPQEMKGLGK